MRDAAGLRRVTAQAGAPVTSQGHLQSQKATDSQWPPSLRPPLALSTGTHVFFLFKLLFIGVLYVFWILIIHVHSQDFPRPVLAFLHAFDVQRFYF